MFIGDREEGKITYKLGITRNYELILARMALRKAETSSGQGVGGVGGRGRSLTPHTPHTPPSPHTSHTQKPVKS
jgi:hypothetical protein